jgi:uncharacterized protein (DUF427 family)
MQQLNPAPGFVKHPDHKVTLKTPLREYQVNFGGNEIARSKRAIAVQEGTYPERLYFPVEDVKIGCLVSNDASTYCPFKGTARYWDVSVGESILENGAWAYDTPYDECTKIAGYICFYTEKSPFEIKELHSN